MSDMVYLAPPEVAQNGLTKREAFAMAAMQGLLAADWHGNGAGINGDEQAKRIATESVRLADAHLAALSAPSPAAGVNAELVEALQRLIEAADDSDGARYGTLSTSFVRDSASAALRKAGVTL